MSLSLPRDLDPVSGSVCVKPNRPGLGATLLNYLKMSRPASAIHELDGLRGIAILLVLFRHAVRAFTHEDAYQPIFPIGNWDAATVFFNGWAGVDLFFLLSGFLITFHIMKRCGSDETVSWPVIKSYLSKRILRIVPAYYAVLFLVVLGAFPFYTIAQDNLGTRLVYHLLFLQDCMPSDILVVFWSLGVEEKFYLVMPFLLIPLIRYQRLSARLVPLVIFYLIPLLLRSTLYLLEAPIEHYSTQFQVFRSPFYMCFDSLLIGSVIAVLYDRRDSFSWWNKARVRDAIFAVGCVIIGLLLLGRILNLERTFFSIVLVPNLLALGFGLIMIALIQGKSGYSKFFRSKILFFFSKISYSLYLIHMVFMFALKDVFVVFLDRYFPGQFVDLGSLLVLYLPVYLTVSVTAALALHYLVEKPFLVLKDRI